MVDYWLAHIGISCIFSSAFQYMFLTCTILFLFLVLLLDLLAATKDVNYKSEKSLPGQLAVYLLARACFEFINDFDMGEENCFDVYPLIRAHIELNECKKEKAPTSQCWINYVSWCKLCSMY